MQEFSLGAEFKPNKYFTEIYEKRRPLIQDMIYDTICLETNFSDIMFFYSYLSDISTRFESYLESMEYLDSRIKVQEYIDSLATITNFGLYNMDKTNELIVGIGNFINSFLHLIFDDAEFNVIKVILTDTMNITEFKFVIEPITFNKLDEKEVENVFKFIESVFGYSRGHNKISIALIKSNNWVKDMEDKPEIIDDNMFNGYFESKPKIFSFIFKTRKNMLKEVYNIDTNYIPPEVKIKESEEQFVLSNDITKYDMEDDTDETTDDFENSNEFVMYNNGFGRYMETLYEAIRCNNKMIFISDEDIDFIHDTYKTVPALAEFFNLMNNNENVNYKQVDDIIKNYYKNLGQLNCDIEEKEISIGDMDIILDQDLPVYEALVDDEGFTKYIPDIYGYSFITKVNGLKNYIEEFTKILVKTDPITIPILNAMTMYFDDFALSDSDIQETDEYLKYICNVDYTNPCTIVRFTIDKNSGIIVDIEVKDVVIK